MSHNIPDPSSEERALAERAGEEFNESLDILMPVSDELSSRIKETGAKRERAGSEASLTAAMESGGAQDMATRAGANSGRFVSGVGDISQAAAGGAAQGTAAGNRQIDQSQPRQQMAVGKMGRGIADDAFQGLSQQAGQAASEAMAGQKRDLMREAAMMDGVGSLAGGATSAYNNWGSGGQ